MYYTEKIETKKAIVVVDNLNFRSAPNLKSENIGKLQKGDIVEILSISNEKERINLTDDYWYKVRFNKKEGYLFDFSFKRSQN